MARSIIRKPSFWKVVGAYRSQWKRFWMRLFTFGMYGRKGMGWLTNPKKAWYNFWYHRTSIDLRKLLGYKPSRGACFFALLIASVASIFAAPVDVTRAGFKAHNIKKKQEPRSKGSPPRSGEKRSFDGREKRPASSTPTERKETPSAAFNRVSSVQNSNSATHKTVSQKPSASAISKAPSCSSGVLLPKNDAPMSVALPKQETPKEEYKEPEENIPKSKPMNNGDEYIRKRLTVSGARYCDQQAVERLTVGSYIELIAESENPHDKNAVALYFDGAKIGYIAKNDVLPYATCLRMNRKVYGVITGIFEKDGQKEIEYETWFSVT